MRVAIGNIPETQVIPAGIALRSLDESRSEVVETTEGLTEFTGELTEAQQAVFDRLGVDKNATIYESSK